MSGVGVFRENEEILVGGERLWGCHPVTPKLARVEGVGLSWAFLRAGATNVTAALWEAMDASTELLMDRFYDELGKGANPDVALRAAKLSLVRNSRFRSPFYRAPFQILRERRFRAELGIGR